MIQSARSQGKNPVITTEGSLVVRDKRQEQTLKKYSIACKESI